jgi:hypothetical protein
MRADITHHARTAIGALPSATRVYVVTRKGYVGARSERDNSIVQNFQQSPGGLVATNSSPPGDLTTKRELSCRRRRYAIPAYLKTPIRPRPPRGGSARSRTTRSTRVRSERPAGSPTRDAAAGGGANSQTRSRPSGRSPGRPSRAARRQEANADSSRREAAGVPTPPAAHHLVDIGAPGPPNAMRHSRNATE